MAVDIFCYCATQVDETDRKIVQMRSDRMDLFANSILLSSAKPLQEVEREIASEAGLENGASLVLLRLNDKSSADRLAEAACVFRSYFEDGSVVTLLEGEKPI